MPPYRFDVLCKNPTEWMLSVDPRIFLPSRRVTSMENFLWDWYSLDLPGSDSVETKWINTFRGGARMMLWDKMGNYSSIIKNILTEIARILSWFSQEILLRFYCINISDKLKNDQFLNKLCHHVSLCFWCHNKK